VTAEADSAVSMRQHNPLKKTLTTLFFLRKFIFEKSVFLLIIVNVEICPLCCTTQFALIAHFKSFGF
jgi:hypothetical protein